MPAISNPKHEAFALARFKGNTADAAYEMAGFKPHRGNAARLSAKESVVMRVAELQAAAASKIIDQSGYDAITLFSRIRRVADAALKAGDHRVALDGEKYIATCFGYEDSPTLTHEHVRGKKLDADEAKTVERESPATNVVRFGKVLGELRKRMGTG